VSRCGQRLGNSDSTSLFFVSQALEGFVVIAADLLAVGVAVASIVTALDRFLIRRGFDDPPTQIMLLALLPFAVYLVANQFGLSGILTAVSAGVTPKSAIDIWHPAEWGRVLMQYLSSHCFPHNSCALILDYLSRETGQRKGFNDPVRDRARPEEL
jgi:hypothetical protein